MHHHHPPNRQLGGSWLVNYLSARAVVPRHPVSRCRHSLVLTRRLRLTDAWFTTASFLACDPCLSVGSFCVRLEELELTTAALTTDVPARYFWLRHRTPQHDILSFPYHFHRCPRLSPALPSAWGWSCHARSASPKARLSSFQHYRVSSSKMETLPSPLETSTMPSSVRPRSPFS